MTRIPVSWGNCELGDVCRLSEAVRLRTFVRDEDSEALKLFHPDQKDHCLTGDWYGEHVGKWLVAAGLSYQANPSPEWTEQIGRVVAFLGDQQEDSGYLGTYASESSARLNHPEAGDVRTWDIWIHAWMLLGLLEVADVPGCEVADKIARRIGEFLLLEFGSGRRVVDQGNHAGLSSLVILEPLALMANRWSDPRYSELAEQIFDQAVESGLDFWNADDVSQIGTGKAYQLLWCLKGILELGVVTGRAEYLGLVQRFWLNVRDHHLTPHGGPWGGIGTHKEVFNAPNFFSPTGLVETCSSVTWMMLSHRLFEVTEVSFYLAEVDRVLYNAILGAIDANGADWCYFTFPNGRRNNTYHWACCKSSGALGLAYAASMVAAKKGPAHRILTLESCRFAFPEGGSVEIEVGVDSVQVQLSHSLRLEIYIAPGLEVFGFEEYGRIQGDWLIFEELPAGTAKFGLRHRLQINQKVHSVDHHGQEIVREEYVCAQVGRYVYAAEKFEGYRTQETLRLPQLAPESVFRVVDDGFLEFRQAGRDVIKMTPYWKCGGRHDGGWRTTWLQVAWQ